MVKILQMGSYSSAFALHSERFAVTGVLPAVILTWAFTHKGGSGRLNGEGALHEELEYSLH
jgi:hypothetical protein